MSYNSGIQWGLNAHPVIFFSKKEDLEAELKKEMTGTENSMRSEFNEKKEQLRKKVSLQAYQVHKLPKY